MASSSSITPASPAAKQPSFKETIASLSAQNRLLRERIAESDLVAKKRLMMINDLHRGVVLAKDVLNTNSSHFDVEPFNPAIPDIRVSGADRATSSAKAVMKFVGDLVTYIKQINTSAEGLGSSVRGELREAQDYLSGLTDLDEETMNFSDLTLPFDLTWSDPDKQDRIEGPPAANKGQGEEVD